MNRPKSRITKIYVREYRSWERMIQRCTNPEHHQYHNYGGRGISVCQRWLASFSAFVEDMGVRPDGTSIDRIDNNGNYEPSNCRWATQHQQHRNTSRTVLFSLDGKVQCAKDWSNQLGGRKRLVVDRLRRGWTEIDALSVKNTIFRLNVTDRERIKDLLACGVTWKNIQSHLNVSRSSVWRSR